MVKLTGKNKINCAIFVSGRGSNLKSIFKYSKKKISKINIKLVISNKRNIPGIIFAKKNKINSKIVNYQNIKSAEKYNEAKGNPNELLGIRTDLSNKKIFEFTKKIRDMGATIFGGCCEIKPSQIRELSKIKNIRKISKNM